MQIEHSDINKFYRTNKPKKKKKRKENKKASPKVREMLKRQGQLVYKRNEKKKKRKRNLKYIKRRSAFPITKEEELPAGQH